MRMLKGNELSSEDQKRVLAMFVHRHTLTHKPKWTEHGKYPPHFKDDQDWLANTYFVVKRDGSLDNRVTYCESHPTWPKNSELRARNHELAKTHPIIDHKKL